MNTYDESILAVYESYSEGLITEAEKEKLIDKIKKAKDKVVKGVKKHKGKIAAGAALATGAALAYGGYKHGKGKGYKQGLAEGHDQAYKKGKAAGYDLGKKDGWDSGGRSGYNEGWSKGRAEGWHVGYDMGAYDVGQEVKKQDKKIKKLKKNLQDPNAIKKAYHKQLSKNYADSQYIKDKMSKESIDKWHKIDAAYFKTKRAIEAKYADNPSERDRLLKQNELKHNILVKRVKKGKDFDDKYLAYNSPAHYVKNSANDVILNLYDLYYSEGVIDESDLEAYIMFINESEDYDDFMDRVYFIESELN